MSELPTCITLDEPLARRALLVRAIESSDTQGRLLSLIERDDIDRLALRAASQGTSDMTVRVEAFLRERTQQLLRVVENRNPALAALQNRRPWAQKLALAALLAAVVFGAATDRIANPHRVDLLSLPLLAIIAWNLLVYSALIAGYFLQRRHHGRAASSSSFMRWADSWHGWPRRASQLRAQVTAVFMRLWYGASAALQAQRWRKLLHLAAAGWAFGVGLSLFTRGLVVEYRVGWESTFLDAGQVHAILRVLLAPVMALFPFQPFSVQDIASLQFSNGSGAQAGARWVYMYATLLAVVVIAPRLLLAFYAGWRERALSRRVLLSLADPYYQRLLVLLSPTRVQLGLLTLRGEDSEALLRVLLPRAQATQAFHSPETAPGTRQTLLRTSKGEELGLVNVPQARTPPAQTNPAAAGWTGRTSRTFNRLLARGGTAPANHTALQTTAGDSDVLLIVVRSADDIAAALPQTPEPGQPTLLLINDLGDATAQRVALVAQCRAQARAAGLQAEVLGFDSFARCWVQDTLLLNAIARCLPRHKKDGFARLAAAWAQRNRELLAQSMLLIAGQLLEAAREVQEVRSAPPFVKRLISAADRQADAQVRQDAMTALSERLQRSIGQAHAQLLRLHGMDDATGEVPEQAFKEKFVIQAPIHAAEAGLAGAATGAASGASIDLLTGGLTLGAAAALGALLGGGAALAGAAWKNRTTPAGSTLIQLSDDMLQALVEAALLRYLGVAHRGRSALAGGPSETAALWASEVVAAVEARKDSLRRYWKEARTQVAPRAPSLGNELQTMARAVLNELYPETSGLNPDGGSREAGQPE